MRLLLFLSFIFHPLLFSSEKIPPSSISFKLKKDKTKKQSKNKVIKDTLPERYLNQAVGRKKEKIAQCALSLGLKPKPFLVEMTILPSGKTKASLTWAEEKNKSVIRCGVRILEAMRFKKFKGPLIKKGYYFEFR